MVNILKSTLSIPVKIFSKTPRHKMVAQFVVAMITVKT